MDAQMHLLRFLAKYALRQMKDNLDEIFVINIERKLCANRRFRLLQRANPWQNGQLDFGGSPGFF